MINRPEKYCGDELMGEYLERLESLRTLHEIYGLFHGCIAASNMVVPSRYFTFLFDESTANYETEEQANEFIGNIMNLWNRIAGWSPETEPLLRPVVDYPRTLAGLTARSAEYNSLITYFIKGLDLGETHESDFSENAFNALKSLSETQAFFKHYSSEWSKLDGPNEGATLQKAFELLEKLEETAGDCIARINLGLEPARMRAIEKMRLFSELKKETPHARGMKTGRNDACPCGSGKKYKKCCGMMH